MNSNYRPVGTKIKRNEKGSAKSCFILIFIVVIILAGGGLFLYNWYNNAIFNPPSNSQELVNLEVVEGDTLISLIPSLKQAGLISSEEAFRVYLRLNNISPNIKAGNYQIAKNVAVPELINILDKGVLKVAFWITIREGLWNDQLADILDEKFNEAGTRKKFSKTDFLSITENPDAHQFLDENQVFLNKYKPSGVSLIGFLYPDTYQFNSDSTASEVIETMITTLQTRIKDKGLDIDNINNNLSNFYDALKLASIIEKEAGGSDDKQLISSVFHNRLVDDWYLQSNATINFITKSKDPRISDEDLAIDSPYNSYKYTGLPPTPVCNPGIDSISAAINPTQSDYYYFRHDTNGNIYFSRTFEEHLQSMNDNP
jgi:UPF0755 protein